MTHRFDPTSLREYDIRGIVGKTLGMEDAKAIGRTFGTMIRRAGGSKIATGYDGRVSSPMLDAGVIEGLNESGVDPVSVGLGPTRSAERRVRTRVSVLVDIGGRRIMTKKQIHYYFVYSQSTR